MPRYPFGKQRIIDNLQRELDAVEKLWPMTGSYERIDPYVIAFLRGHEYYELIIYHIESKLWFDNDQYDTIINYMVDKSLIAEGDVVFDLGSNAGAVTLTMAKLAGTSGQVHAFDPYPWNALATKYNARINHLDNVTAHAVGVSNRSYEINVSPNDSRIYESSDEVNAQLIAIRDIRDYMTLKPAFLKIDIEGAEYDLFDKQAPGTFDSLRGFVLEFHPFWIRGRDLDPVVALRNVQTAGFDLHYHTLETPRYAVDHYVDDHHLFWGRRKSA